MEEKEDQSGPLQKLRGRRRYAFFCLFERSLFGVLATRLDHSRNKSLFIFSKKKVSTAPLLNRLGLGTYVLVVIEGSAATDI